MPDSIIACAITACPRRAVARGWCMMHWKRWWKHGDPTIAIRPQKRICAVDGCGRSCYGRGWCHRHWLRWWRHGDPFYAPMDHPPATVHDGYVFVQMNKTQIAFHRVIWEHHHGPIPRGFQVHHVNEDRFDNRIENLELIHIVAHAKLHDESRPRDPDTGRFV